MAGWPPVARKLIQSTLVYKTLHTQIAVYGRRL